MNKEDREKFAAIVRTKREEKGWSQEKLGQQSGLATNTVFCLEKGNPTVPRTRAKVAATLGIKEPCARLSPMA